MCKLKADVITYCPGVIMQEEFKLWDFAFINRTCLFYIWETYRYAKHTWRSRGRAEQVYIECWPQSKINRKQVQEWTNYCCVNQRFVLYFVGLVFEFCVLFVYGSVRVVEAALFQNWIKWISANVLEGYYIYEGKAEEHLRKEIQVIHYAKIGCVSI